MKPSFETVFNLGLEPTRTIKPQLVLHLSVIAKAKSQQDC